MPPRASWLGWSMPTWQLQTTVAPQPFQLRSEPDGRWSCRTTTSPGLIRGCSSASVSFWVCSWIPWTPGPVRVRPLAGRAASDGDAW
jgi:hypothetical protein